jgi:hypothetical protein
LVAHTNRRRQMKLTNQPWVDLAESIKSGGGVGYFILAVADVVHLRHSVN